MSVTANTVELNTEKTSGAVIGAYGFSPTDNSNITFIKNNFMLCLEHEVILILCR